MDVCLNQSPKTLGNAILPKSWWGCTPFKPFCNCVKVSKIHSIVISSSTKANTELTDITTLISLYPVYIQIYNYYGYLHTQVIGSFQEHHESIDVNSNQSQLTCGIESLHIVIGTQIDRDRRSHNLIKLMNDKRIY